MPHQLQETFYGSIETVNEALAIIEATRRGVLPRVLRRLNQRERLSIKSGSVFVWEEGETGILRWTDGRCWSSSRVISGHFILYCEQPKGHSKKRFVSEELAKTRLHKKILSVATSDGKNFHLAAYYVPEQVERMLLPSASALPMINNMIVPAGFYTPRLNAHHFLIPPVTTRLPSSKIHTTPPGNPVSSSTLKAQSHFDQMTSTSPRTPAFKLPPFSSLISGESDYAVNPTLDHSKAPRSLPYLSTTVTHSTLTPTRTICHQATTSECDNFGTRHEHRLSRQTNSSSSVQKDFRPSSYIHPHYNRDIKDRRQITYY
ncbi:Gti1/Pac2 family-domain-containing protein [Paraphysoderma sedebokerense]|nr:Gti1/Pac2 family-domain-containing protein [Paraphysoderma sedebokerense]